MNLHLPRPWFELLAEIVGYYTYYRRVLDNLWFIFEKLRMINVNTIKNSSETAHLPWWLKLGWKFLNFVILISWLQVVTSMPIFLAPYRVNCKELFDGFQRLSVIKLHLIIVYFVPGNYFYYHSFILISTCREYLIINTHCQKKLFDRFQRL